MMITDYVFHVGSVKQASKFKTTSEFIINYIRKTYEYSSDIGNALENLQPMDSMAEKPKLKTSLATLVLEEKSAVKHNNMAWNLEQTTISGAK
eukprot:scaffold12295_cov58-Attheya_sp.AAC.5